MLQYTNPENVTGTRSDETPPTYGRSASGYGGKIPTAYEIQYLGRWRRVYAMCYGNACTLYVLVRGVMVILDSDTVCSLES